MLKNENIYPHGYTSRFTYNDIDYDLVENYDKDVYELYLKHLKDYFIDLHLRLSYLKNDIKIATKIKILSKPSYQEVKITYNSIVSEFTMHISHFTVYYVINELNNIGNDILSLFVDIHACIEEYNTHTINAPSSMYMKILKVEETPGHFTNTIRKLNNSVYRDKLEKLDIKKLERY